MPGRMSRHAGSPVPPPRPSPLPSLPSDPVPNEGAARGNRAAAEIADGDDRVIADPRPGRWPRVAPSL